MIYKKDKGSVLILSLLVMTIILLFGGIFLSLTNTNYVVIMTDSDFLKAQWIARAGINQMIHDVRDHYFSYNKFLETQKRYASGVKFGDGTYKGAIGVIIGPGIREILLISEGIMDENNKDAIMIKLRITTAADFLKFVDGHYNCSDTSTWWGEKTLMAGPVHANGSIRFIRKGSSNYIHIRKDIKLKGPVLSATDIVFFETIDKNFPIIIGEGDISGLFNPDTDINKYTSSTRNNDIGISQFYLDQYPANYTGLFLKPVPTSFSNGSSPDITFEVTREDGTKQPLLMDGFHGAYKISIPDKDKIFTEFQPYIDMNWHITYDKLCGGEMVTFYNDDMQKKTKLTGGGQTYTFPSAGLEELGNVKISSAYFGSFDNANPNNYNLADASTQDVKHLDFYPMNYLVNALYENGATLIDKDSYRVQYDGGKLPLGSEYWLSKCGRIIFNNPSYTTSTKIYSTKLRGIYVTNDTVDYRARGMDASVSVDDRKGIMLSPVNIQQINNSGLITLKSFINEAPLINDRSGVFYKTANLMNQNSVVITSVKEYNYGGKDYTSVLNGTVSSDILTENITNINWLNSTLWYNRTIYSELIKDGTYIDMYGNLVDARTGGYVIFRPKEYKLSRGGPPYYSEDYYNDNPYANKVDGYKNVTRHFPPIVQKPGTGGGGSNPPSNPSAEPDEVHLYYFDNSVNNTIPADTSDNRLYEISSDGIVTKTSTGEVQVGISYPWTYTRDGDLIDGLIALYNFNDFRFTSQLPSYPILMSYKYKYRPITNVSATLYSPNSAFYSSNYNSAGYGSSVSYSGFNAVCIDPLIKAVEIDLSDINDNNYPKYGIIFSDVPLVIKGIPKKEITIVCLDDIYLGSINATYYNSDGGLVNSDLTDDDIRAYPVGIITAGGVWNYFHLNRKTSIPSENIPYNLTYTDPSFRVRLNKVVIYTQADDFSNYGGLAGTNTGDLVGSFISGVSQMGPDVVNAKYLNYNYSGFQYRSYKQGTRNSWGFNPQKYASSFRKNLPPHFPSDIRIKNWKSFSSVDAEQYINEIQKYLLDSAYTEDPEKLENVYKELTYKYLE